MTINVPQDVLRYFDQFHQCKPDNITAFLVPNVYTSSVILLALTKIRTLRIENFAVINLRGVSTNKSII